MRGYSYAALVVLTCIALATRAEGHANDAMDTYERQVGTCHRTQIQSMHESMLCQLEALKFQAAELQRDLDVWPPAPYQRARRRP